MTLHEPLALELVRNNSDLCRIRSDVRSESEQREKHILIGVRSVGFGYDSVRIDPGRVREVVIVFGQILSGGCQLMSRFCAGKDEIVSHDMRCLPLSLFCLSLLGLCEESATTNPPVWATSTLTKGKTYPENTSSPYGSSASAPRPA
jgi:hypothetical protein